LLNGEIFDTIQEASVLIKKWSADYNTAKPYNVLEYMPTAPESWLVDITELIHLTLLI
jgi:putative transposase